MLALLFCALAFPPAAPAVGEAAATRMQQKMDQILANSTKPVGQRGPAVTLTEEEINSYFALRMAGRVPKGVSGIRVEIHPDRSNGYATVDFDEYKAAAKRPMNPMLDFFLKGRRAVAATGTVDSLGGGQARYRLDSVSLDDLTVKGALLQYLIRWFVLPRYPKAAMDQPFELPAGVQRVDIQEGKIVVYP
jgi:hypothetical protein